MIVLTPKELESMIEFDKSNPSCWKELCGSFLILKSPYHINFTYIICSTSDYLKSVDEKERDEIAAVCPARQKKENPHALRML